MANLEVNIEKVLSLKNDKFRKTVNVNGKDYIYDNSINTAKRIVKELSSTDSRTNHVMLVAKMQSGKTSVCNSVVNIITKTKLQVSMGIDKFMFISGMNDCGLKDQTYLRLIQQVIDANVDNVYIGKRSKKNLGHNKFYVMKNSDLMNYVGDLDNTLIFIDESHYGSNEKNILTKFLNKHKIDWKNTKSLIKRHIFIVSVSATPFDELVSDTIQCKRMVELKTDSNYVGVSEYINNDLIFDANKDDVEEEGKIFEYIQDAKERMDNTNNGVGVIFIRTRKFNIVMDNEYVRKHFDVYPMYSGESAIEYEKMNNAVDSMIKKNEFNANFKAFSSTFVKDMDKLSVRPMIVLIKGAYRAGVTIPEHMKDYVYMVYDYSLKSDTTAQALLGRMCGYRHDTDKISNTYFYINKKYADMYSVWENDFTNRKAIPCDKMKYVWADESECSDFQDKELRSRCCGNIAISLTDKEIEKIYNVGKVKKNRMEFMKQYLPTLLRQKCIDLKYDYIGETHISGKNNYALSSQEKRFNNFSSDAAVFSFRPQNLKDFIQETKRTFLTNEDIGKKAVFTVLDAEIHEDGNTFTISGNKRLLLYCVEVSERIRIPNRDKMYKPHKDTFLRRKKIS